MKQHFDTGACRDDDTDKPRIDLIDLAFMRSIYRQSIALVDSPSYISFILEWGIHRLPEYTSQERIANIAAYMILKEYPNLETTLYPPPVMIRLGALLAKGAVHYGSDNWRQGMPFTRTYQSLLRHVYQWLNNEPGEDHFAASLFNLMCLYVYLGGIELGVLPSTLNDFERAK
jgi:hypothetical protein